MENLMTFGRVTNQKICTMLFVINIIVDLILSVFIGYLVYMNTTYERIIQVESQLYSTENIPNLPLGIACGIVMFIVGFILCKVLCEIVFIVLEFFKARAQ